MSKINGLSRGIKQQAPTPIHKEIQNEAKNLVANGAVMNGALSDAIMGFNPGGIGTQLNQVDTLFKNNRWYLISNMRQLLSEIYVEHGLVQTIVDVPVDDGLRGGVEIESKQLSEQQIQDLRNRMEREDDITTVGQGIKWNRLFGGAGILILTGQDWEMPLDIAAIAIDEPLAFRAVDLWELSWDKQNLEGYESQNFEFYSYYGKKIHKSRVLKMKGLTPPSFICPRLRGWGLSVVEVLVNSINQYLKSNNLTFEVLDEFKVDVFKIKNLTNSLMSPQGAQKLRERLNTANHQKNYQNALAMDSEDDYIQKELSFTGIAETMAGIRMQVASDMRMPLTKLFGISAAGFSSGEDDIENYNSMVESQVRAKSKFDILRMIELRCQQMFGFVPDDLSIEFHPLRVLSSEQEENVKTQKFQRLLQAKQAGEITSLEFRDACNRDNLLSIQLDTSESALDAADEESDEGDEESSESESGKAPKSKTTAKEAPKAKS